MSGYEQVEEEGTGKPTEMAMAEEGWWRSLCTTGTGKFGLLMVKGVECLSRVRVFPMEEGSPA